MENNKLEKNIKRKPKFKRVRKKSEMSTSQPKHLKGKKELEVNQEIILSDS
ncbi:hypothetical protein A2U01_0114770, partial [Trifolium medium]|nr:hypothetical protein [Trifolium medium]